MIRSLFRKADANPATELYGALTAAARQPGWYRDAGVPDTMDGRYCVLATLLALADLRLAAGSASEQALSPRLTELFVADMDAQLCQSGMGDPTLGKTVRAMVAGVAARIARLEAAIGSGEWGPALGFALYRDADVDAAQESAAVALIASLAGDRGDTQVVNLRNDGTLPFLPDEAVIEVPATITSAGATALPVAPVEPLFAGLIAHVTAYETLAIEAALHGGEDRVADALLAHPLIGQASLSGDLARRLIEANRGHLSWATA